MGDIIAAVDGVERDEFANTAELFIKLHTKAGDSVTLDVIRDGTAHSDAAAHSNPEFPQMIKHYFPLFSLPARPGRRLVAARRGPARRRSVHLLPGPLRRPLPGGARHRWDRAGTPSPWTIRSAPKRSSPDSPP